LNPGRGKKFLAHRTTSILLSQLIEFPKPQSLQGHCPSGIGGITQFDRTAPHPPAFDTSKEPVRAR
jgi:hypothetical protein